MSMRKIAVIGAGQTGATAALILLNEGHDVTLYSDRSAQGILDDTPATGTAHVFGESVATERRFGLHTYEGETPVAAGYTFCVSAEPAPRADMVFAASLQGRTGRAADTRLISYDRINAFVAGGGTFLIEDVTADSLDGIAARHELTLVSVGKGGLSSLFPRDAARSELDAPARNLLMVTVAGVPADPDTFGYRMSLPDTAGLLSVIANITVTGGEMFWTPYLHKTVGPSWNLFVEAKFGGPFDCMADVTSAEGALSAIRALVDEYAPWDSPVISQMELIGDDAHSWLKGRILPSVRSAAGRTPGGQLVMSLGDTSITYDPIAGQGANSGIKQVAHYADAIAAHDGRPLGEEWMTRTFENYYRRQGLSAMRLTNVYLGEYPEATNLVVLACCADRRVADGLARLWVDPPWRWPLAETDSAMDFIAELTGEDPQDVLARGEKLLGQTQA